MKDRGHEPEKQENGGPPTPQRGEPAQTCFPCNSCVYSFPMGTPFCVHAKCSAIVIPLADSLGFVVTFVKLRFICNFGGQWGL